MMDTGLIVEEARIILRNVLAVPYRQFATGGMTTMIAIAMTPDQFETLKRFAESD